MGLDTPSTLDLQLHSPQHVLGKYFSTWRKKVLKKKEKDRMMCQKMEQREKLNDLVRSLKERAKSEKNVPSSCSANNKRINSNESYKNRYQAQNFVINKLTSQLEQRDKVISDLKLGILNGDAMRSLSESKIEISEIFGKCSQKTKRKIAPPVEYVEKFMISTQKAPKILREMEARADQRAKKHEIIQERKRVIDEKRKKLIEEMLEKKNVQDEEAKKVNLEVIKERRRKELEREKVRQANKLIYLEKLQRAVALHNRLLKRTYFKRLYFFYRECQFNESKSRRHYVRKTLKKAMVKWQGMVEAKYQWRYMIADELFSVKLLARSLNTWKEARLEGIRNRQVAEDFYDFTLAKNTFVHWHRYVCTQIVLEDKKSKIATCHHRRRLLFNTFHQWRSLPAVLQLERAKEEKKKKWREKVWEILPDYKPPHQDQDLY